MTPRLESVRFRTEPMVGSYMNLFVFHLKQPKLKVTDPCYEPDTWCSYLIPNMKLGHYAGITEIVKDDWGNRVASLSIIHTDYGMDVDLLENKWKRVEDAHIGVDSGQAGFFDAEIYETLFKNGEREEEFEKFYEECGNNTIGEYVPTTKGYSIMKPSVSGALYKYSGFVSQSGYGDGGYNLYTIEENGEVTAAKIVFIGHEEEEEE